MLLLATIFFGLTGLVIMLFLQWITRQSYAQESVDKHGISQLSASRMGGVAIIVTTLALLAYNASADILVGIVIDWSHSIFDHTSVRCCAGRIA